MLFWQAKLLAKSFHPRVAPKHGISLKSEQPTHPHRSNHGGATQSFESPVLVAQTGEDLGFAELVQRTIGRKFLRLLTPARTRVGTAKNAGRRIDAPIEGCFEDLDGLAEPPLE